jgi:hypothetical protein
MPGSQDQLLADRELSLQIDNNELPTALFVSLACLRMEPQPAVLTTVLKTFSDEEVAPLVQRYLQTVGMAGSSLYIAGSDVPRTVERVIAVILKQPLEQELEEFIQRAKRVTTPAQKKTIKRLRLHVRTSPDVCNPVFVPVAHRRLTEPCAVERVGKPARLNTTPKVRTIINHVTKKSTRLRSLLYVCVQAVDGRASATRQYSPL